MEPQRLGPTFFVFILITAVAGGFYYFNQVDEANEAFLDAQKARELTGQLMVEKQKQWRDVQAKAGLTQAITVQRVAVKESGTRLATLKRGVEADLKYLTEAVARVRKDKISHSQSSPVPSLRLKDGSTLTNVRVSRIQDSVLSVVHDGGIVQLGIGEIPPALVREFDLGPDSIQAGLKTLQQAAGLEVNDPDAVDWNLARGYERQLRQLQEAHERGWRYARDREAVVAEYEAQIGEAESEGQVTIDLRTLRDVAESNAGEARIQLAKLEKEMDRVRKALDEEKQKP